MKKLLIGVSFLSILLLANTGQKTLAQDVTVSFQTFYDELSPYGQWIYDPQYGNVWVPNEENDFRPYGSRGHWVMTDYGNTWVSEDPWGWACYHYGRWTYDTYYGWIWVPGYEWAPAWVSWRYGGGYSGWAPLGPGVSINVGYNCPESWWIFVEPHYMYQRDCYRHWRGPSYNNGYIRHTNVINNYYVDNGTHVRYNFGPRREEIEKTTHQPVQVYRMDHTSRPGAPTINGNRVSMYRPAVNRNSMREAHPQNVIQAPRSIGRPQQATNVEPNRQSQFRQEHLRNPQPPVNRAEPQRQQPQRQEPQRAQPPMNRPEPQRQQPQRQEPQRAQPPMNRPEPQRQQPQRQEPQRAQPPMNRPEPQRQQRQEPQRAQPPVNRPEPQRQQPQRQEPQRAQPPMNRPEPQRQQPPVNRPAPQRQQQAPPPQRQPQTPPPQRQAPPQRTENEHREGGRR